MNKLAHLFGLLVLTLVAASPSEHNSARRNQPVHVRLAEELVAHCSARNTAYQHSNGVVNWKTDTSDYQSYTDCSGFLNALLKQSYQYAKPDFKAWLGASRPYAYHYYDAISSENRFKSIHQIGDVAPGDLIAIKYVDRSEHDSNTGHCMLVDGMPHRIADVPILLNNTQQYEVRVIDSSKSPHGKEDTRRGTDDTVYDGLGSGLFRLYTDEQGHIMGYSWSLQRPKEGFDPLENPILIGRLTVL